MFSIYIVLLILGIVQGIAEFLPISSSGHLVILEQISFFKNQLSFIGKDGNLFINVSLHIATLIAVIIYLRNDIANLIKGSISGLIKKDFTVPEFKIISNIILASIPAGVIGLLFHDFFEYLFSSISAALIFLIINGLILITTKIIPIKDRKIEETGLFRSIVIGFFQAFAILPGISRSGMTIAGGMLNGMEPVESAKFSFLMAIPVIAGAGVIEFIKVMKGDIPEQILIPISLSMVITIIVALFSLKLLFTLVKKIRIDIFGYYTMALGICGLVIIHLILQ